MPLVPSSPGECGYDLRGIDHLAELEALCVTGAIIRALGSELNAVAGRIEEFAADVT